MNKQYTDGMKLAGPKVTFKFLLELHLERQNNTKRPHVKTKGKNFRPYATVIIESTTGTNAH